METVISTIEILTLYLTLNTMNTMATTVSMITRLDRPTISQTCNAAPTLSDSENKKIWSYQIQFKPIATEIDINSFKCLKQTLNIDIYFLLVFSCDRMFISHREVVAARGLHVKSLVADCITPFTSKAAIFPFNITDIFRVKMGHAYHYLEWISHPANILIVSLISKGLHFQRRFGTVCK